MWLDERIVAFDCETTGTDVEEARIVAAAVAFCGGGKPTETWTVLIDPGVEIPEEATAVHGITTEQARAEGVSAREGIDAILEQLARRRPEWPLAAFNARFDLTVLDREARRHGLPIVSVEPVLDPLVIDKHLHRYRTGSRRLDAQAEHYGAKLDEAHDAASDAVCAARVAWAIGRRGKVIRRRRNQQELDEYIALCADWKRIRYDLPALHVAQRRWAAAQAASLEEYFREQGKPEPVAREWPVIPMLDRAAA